MVDAATFASNPTTLQFDIESPPRPRPEPWIIAVDPRGLRLDAGPSRGAIDEDLVAEYAEAMAAGVRFPRVVAFTDAAPGAWEFDYWLADGFHRVAAEIRAGLHRTIAVELYRGDMDDAIRYGRALATGTGGDR